MTLQEVIDYLKYYNNWRRGAEVKMPNPEKIGLSLDYAIKYLESDCMQCKNKKIVPAPEKFEGSMTYKDEVGFVVFCDDKIKISNVRIK